MNTRSDCGIRFYFSFHSHFVTWMLGISTLVSAGPLAAADRNLRFTSNTPAETAPWQRQVRQKLFELMMGGAQPQRVGLAPTVVRRESVPGARYVLEELTLQSLPDRRAHAWVARPAQPSGKVGAVLAIHGHGGSGENVVRGQSLYGYGRVLAEMGYVVIAPDVGQHELQHTTWSLMGERTWDAIRSLDYLTTLPEVDTNRLAVAGLSLGGETTMYVAALDERLSIVCSSGWLTTVANMKNGHCPCFNFAGLEENFDFADIFACVAPRRLVCELGALERAPGGFPIETGEQAAQEIRAAYRTLAVDSRFTLTFHPAGHVFDGRDFYPALAAQFNGTPLPIEAAKTINDTVEAFPHMRMLWDRTHDADALANLPPQTRQRLAEAEQNGRLAAEGLFRCRRYVDGWLAHCDPETGLFPRNFRESRDFWNGRDCGADNYPFMVLTAAFTDQALLEGRLTEMLRTEARLTSRIDRLPDDYSFSKKGWRREKANLDEIIFDGAEYVKDGLLYVTEWLGPCPWSERALGIIDDIWKNAPISTPFGNIPTLNFEVNGDLLQSCSRLFWFTGDRKYLDWATRLGDFYLLSTNHPTRDMKELRLMDHGCEVINGLSELSVALSKAHPEKRAAYQKPFHELLDKVLELGRNEDGLFYTAIFPQTNSHGQGLCDTWGYDYDAFYTMFLLDGTGAYRDAVRMALSHLKGKYVGSPWADRSADGYADSIEGAINLFNREPISDAADWVDSQTRRLWTLQKADGVIEGWHGDGNFARTTLMYVLWKTQGTHVEPWRDDVCIGAVRDGNNLIIHVATSEPWTGRILFDEPRHKTRMHLPLDYPRINQFPEWFTTETNKQYTVSNLVTGEQKKEYGALLQNGLPLELGRGAVVALRISPK